MTAIHDVFEVLVLCAVIVALVLFAMWARRRLRPPVAPFFAGKPPLRRSGLTQRVVFTVIGGGMMIPDLLVPVFGEVADLVIAIVLAYAWYTYYAQPGTPLVRLTRAREFPAGVDECVRCGGSGFTDGKIDPLCAGKGWVPGNHRPA